MFVRVIGVLIVTTGAAHASSFVAMGELAPASTPSIVSLGVPAPARIAETRPSHTLEPEADRHSFTPDPHEAEAIAGTPSIVAMGEPWPQVTSEQVAAIPRNRRRGPDFRPLVIRGGLVGDAFAVAKPDSPKAAAAPTQEASASQGDEPEPAPAPDAPPAYLPPNGLGKHRW